LRNWIDRPAQIWLRRAVFQVHLWVGVAVAAWLLLMSATGSVLVFHDQLAHETVVTTRVLDDSSGTALQKQHRCIFFER
jgi:uncharacterized iron-regulated membrane protein